MMAIMILCRTLLAKDSDVRGLLFGVVVLPPSAPSQLLPFAVPARLPPSCDLCSFFKTRVAI